MDEHPLQVEKKQKPPAEKIDFTRQKYVTIRIFQLIFIAAFFLGGMWAATDILMIMLPDVPISSLAVLLLLYGLVGAAVSENLARRWETELERRTTRNFREISKLPAPEQSEETALE